jgi:aminopeptidase N
MKRLLVCAFLLVLSHALFAQRNIDVLHYKYSLELNDNNDTIYGVAEIKLTFLAPVNNITFDLVKKSDKGKGMITDDVTGPGVRGFSKDAESLSIFLTPTQSSAAKDTAVFKIRYHGIPADGLIISKNKYGNRTFFADNWPNRAHNWIPCVDDPADKASVEFIVTAPSHYQVISNGIKIEETNLSDNKKLTHWKEEVPLPTKVMVIGAADFAVQHAGSVNDCIPVSSWVYPENKDKGFYDYTIAKDILTFFNDYIGPYGYKKLANVQSKTRFGGMENAGAIFYAEETVTGNRDEERLIAHEIVHQWFGNMATEKSFAHFWLSEGFATYLTHIYLEAKYGADSLADRMREDRNVIIDFVNSSHRPVVDSTKDYMRLLNANSYQKGGWVLHMLRRELGDVVFKKSIRDYYATYAGKNADTDDLKKIFETISGKNLDQFFKQWLYTGENPRLEIKWSYDAANKKLNIHVKQLQKTVFNFPLEVEVALENQGLPKSEIKKLAITKLEETFVLPVGSKAALLTNGIDPLTSLLFQYSLSEIK